MLKVVRIWWDSLANAEQFKKSRRYHKSDKDRHYAIPSAPGKRFNTDIKVTDLLYKCQEKGCK